MTRWFEAHLRVSGWDSDYRSVQRLLDHLARKTKSAASRKDYLEAVASLSRREKKSPEELVGLAKAEVEDAVQTYMDDMAKNGRSIRSVNTFHAQVTTFFRLNGFKKARELEVERYHQPVRYRKKPEYVPTPLEVWRMAIAGENPLEKSVLLTVYETGLRNSTARAVRYSDIQRELEFNAAAQLAKFGQEGSARDLLKRLASRGAACGTPEEFVECLVKKREAGVQKFYFQTLVPENTQMIELLADILEHRL